MDMIIANSLKRIREGDTELLVPKASLEEKVPPHSPAFFNPLAKLNRDISIYLYNAFLTENHFKGDITFADALSGVGSRGLRVAVEVPRVSKIFINDINKFAINISRDSAALNSIADKCIFSTKEVCEFLISHNWRDLSATRPCGHFAKTHRRRVRGIGGGCIQARRNHGGLSTFLRR
jgi:tRNA (guanine26-N2/guanine27-N2)-dimethyltransferase